MRPDVLLVSLGSTFGLRAADDALAASLRRAGASVHVARAAAPRSVRTLALTDLGWARAARRAALSAPQARVSLYSTTTAALLWPRPGAIRFDAPATANRPGRHGVWQRVVERRRLDQAPLLVPQSDGALREAGTQRAASLVVPIPVEASGPWAASRDIAAITYATNPEKKGLDLVLAAWAAARRGSEELVVAGVDAAQGASFGPTAGVRFAGRLAPGEYRSLLRRARVYVTAPRREDHGVAQLEALADGCHLVTTPAPGAYVALGLTPYAGPQLTPLLRAALDAPAPDRAERAELLRPFAPATVDALVAGELLPALMALGS